MTPAPNAPSYGCRDRSLPLTVFVVGPTASGKTELAVALAGEIGGEVVSADSRQVYRGLDAGTAKPARDDRGRVGGVPYHLVDCAEPSEAFDAGRWAEMARAVCAEIRRRGRNPIVAGGTGLYVRALLEGLSQMPGRDPTLRRRLEEEALRNGRPWLHARLADVDPVAAGRIPPNNIQRVVRALEVYELTGRPISSLWDRGPRRMPEGRLVLSIVWPVSELRERIAERAAGMWPRMLREVRALGRLGLTGEEPGLQSLGYREALACARGSLSEEEGLRRLIRSTLSYAKRQRTWFGRQLPGAVEIPGGPLAGMLERALETLGRVHETTGA